MAGIVSMATNTPELDPQRQEYLQDVARLKALGEARDLKGLEELAAKLEGKWFSTNKEYYGPMMLEICGNFRSWDFKDEEQFELEKRYARLALERSYKLQENDKIPMEVEFKLLRHVQQSVQYLKDAVKSEDWSNRRSTMAKLYFHTWHRLEKTIDPNWDANEPFLPWPRPSAYDGIWFSGMSPEAIKDPNIRAEYEVALEGFWRKQKRYTEERHLRRLKKRFLPHLQEDILRLYSGPVFDSKKLENEALQRDLEKHIDDKRVRTMISDFITEKLLEEIRQKPKE